MLKKHGNMQIEFNKYFNIPKNIKHEEYTIDIWFFIPSTLLYSSYDNSDFFNDFTSYTRYNAPNLSLKTLADFNHPKNPLTRIGNKEHTRENFSEIEYELKTLLNTFKVSMQKIITTLGELNKSDSDLSKNKLIQKIELMKQIQDRLIELNISDDKQFKDIYNLALEGLSLRIEKTFYSIYSISEEFQPLSIDVINKQRQFRINMGYSSVTSENEESNSQAIYREHIIKKWSESIMYLNIENSKTHKGLNQIFLGSAAALAMLISGIATILVARMLGGDSIYLFITALFLYSIKDRFKDLFKAIFLKRMISIFYEKVKIIQSPLSRRRCGRSMESVYFPKYEDLDKDAKKLRFYQKDDISIKQYQEDIIRYSKLVKIKTGKLYKNHTRLFGIREIMRFDLRHLFYKMDKEDEKCYLPDGNSLKQVKGDREYHFNLIVRIKNSRGSDLTRYRIVANSRKIKKVIAIKC